MRRRDGRKGREKEAGKPETAQARGEGASPEHDLDRLERLVAELARGYEQLRSEDVALRSQIEARESRIERLDTEIRTANKKRQKAIEHLDELLLQIDRLESELVERLPESFAGAAAGAAEGEVQSHRAGVERVGAAAPKTGH